MKKIISLALVLCMIVPFCIFDMGVTGSAAHQEIDDASTTKWYTWGQHYYNANNTPYEPDYSYSGDLTHSVDTTSDYYKVSPNPVTWKISNGGIVAQNKTFKPAHVSSSVAKIKPGGFNITFTRESGDYITTNHRGVMSIGFIFDDDLPFKSFPVNYDNMSVWGVLGRSNTYNDSKSLTVNFYNTTDNSAALGIQYNYFRVFYNTSKLTNEFTNLPVTEGTLSKPFIFGTTYTGKLYLTRTGTNTFTLYYQRGTNAAQALATGLSIDENADIKYVAAVTGGYAGNESDATGSDTLTIKTVGKCGSASNAPNGFTGGGHAFETTVAATCLTAGTETCSCGVTRTVAAYGHDFGSWQDASGYQYRECSRCGICEKKVTVTYYDHTGANPTTQTGTVEVASSSGLGAANVSITTKAANTFTLTDDANTYGEAAGYEFNGWASSALTPGNEASSVKSASTAYNFTSNTSLYANWKAKTFSLTLDPNGGSLASGVTSPVSIKYKQVYSTVFSSYPTATRNGYVFNNWDYNGWEFNSTKMSETYSAAGNATLTAKWTPKTSALTFNMNGGSGTAPTGLVATYGQAMPTYGQSAPTNGVMVFEGFYDDPSGGTKYYNSNLSSARSWDKDITVGTTLYAHWGTSYGYENGDAVTNKQMTNSADSTWKSKWNVFHNGSERIKLKTNETNDARKGYLQFEGQNVTGFSSGVTSGTQTKLFGSSVSFSIDSNWTSNDIISLAFSNAHMNVQPSNAGQVPTGIYANVSSAYNEDFAPAYGNDIENITENSVHKPGVSISIRTLTPEENATEVIVNDVWVKMYDPNNLNNCQTYHYKYNWYDTSSGDVTYMKTLYGNDGVNPPLMRCTLPGVVRLDAAGRIVTNGSEKVFDPLTLKLGPDAENTISFDDDGDLFINGVKITPYQDRKLNNDGLWAILRMNNKWYVSSMAYEQVFWYEGNGSSVPANVNLYEIDDINEIDLVPVTGTSRLPGEVGETRTYMFTHPTSDVTYKKANVAAGYIGKAVYSSNQITGTSGTETVNYYYLTSSQEIAFPPGPKQFLQQYFANYSNAYGSATTNTDSYYVSFGVVNLSNSARGANYTLKNVNFTKNEDNPNNGKKVRAINAFQPFVVDVGSLTKILVNPASGTEVNTSFNAFSPAVVNVNYGENIYDKTIEALHSANDDHLAIREFNLHVNDLDTPNNSSITDTFKYPEGHYNSSGILVGDGDFGYSFVADSTYVNNFRYGYTVFRFSFHRNNNNQGYFTGEPTTEIKYSGQYTYDSNSGNISNAYSITPNDGRDFIGFYSLQTVLLLARPSWNDPTVTVYGRSLLVFDQNCAPVKSSKESMVEMLSGSKLFDIYDLTQIQTITLSAMYTYGNYRMLLINKTGKDLTFQNLDAWNRWKNKDVFNNSSVGSDKQHLPRVGDPVATPGGYSIPAYRVVTVSRTQPYTVVRTDIKYAGDDIMLDGPTYVFLDQYQFKPLPLNAWDFLSVKNNPAAMTNDFAADAAGVKTVYSNGGKIYGVSNPVDYPASVKLSSKYLCTIDDFGFSFRLGDGFRFDTNTADDYDGWGGVCLVWSASKITANNTVNAYFRNSAYDFSIVMTGIENGGASGSEKMFTSIIVYTGNTVKATLSLPSGGIPAADPYDNLTTVALRRSPSELTKFTVVINGVEYNTIDLNGIVGSAGHLGAIFRTDGLIYAGNDWSGQCDFTLEGVGNAYGIFMPADDIIGSSTVNYSGGGVSYTQKPLVTKDDLYYPVLQPSYFSGVNSWTIGSAYDRMFIKITGAGNTYTVSKHS